MAPEEGRCQAMVKTWGFIGWAWRWDLRWLEVEVRGENWK